MIRYYITTLLCRWGFHRPRYWQNIKRYRHNNWVYKVCIAEGAKCQRCGKPIWRKDYGKRGPRV